MPCTETTPYYSVDENVYHVCSNCSIGDNIQPDKKRVGNQGSRTLCDRCKDIRAGRVPR